MIGAEEQSLDSPSSNMQSSAKSTPTIVSASSKGDESKYAMYEERYPGLPQLIFAAGGHIRLETLSWLEIIRRKHMSPSETDVTGAEANISSPAGELFSSNSSLGRTALASQRAHELISKNTGNTDHSQ